jgi:hypothetical protein
MRACDGSCRMSTISQRCVVRAIRPDGPSGLSAGPPGPKQLLSQKPSLNAAERQRLPNIARQAVDSIFECRQAGNQAAHLRLMDFADRLQEAAAYYKQVQKSKQ